MISKEDIFNEQIKENELSVEFQYFKLFFSDEIIELFSKASNEYYRQSLIDKYGTDYENKILQLCSKQRNKLYEYFYITRGIRKYDILLYIGIKIYMGLHRYPNLKSYWSKFYTGPYDFNKIIPRTYYDLLAHALHFPETDESEKKKESESSIERFEFEHNADPRHKIQFFLYKLSQNFQKYYELGENITIDESLVIFHGKSAMKFYIPMKPHKWGFKIHLLCDSDTNYLYNMLFDPGRAGKDFINNEGCDSLSESIVLKLLEPINDKKKRNIFFDGWYSSIGLMRKLTKLGFLNTTVLRSTSKELPEKIKKEGYDKAYSENILIQKYEGRKTIYFATNYKINIEELRNIYNIKNRAVDTFDHYLQLTSIQRRTVKWYKKIFLFGIEAAIINSKLLYELKTGKRTTSSKFKEKLVIQIFDFLESKKVI